MLTNSIYQVMYRTKFVDKISSKTELLLTKWQFKWNINDILSISF